MVELLVSISIIGIMATAVVLATRDSGAQGRDLERQADLRRLASEIETYKRREGSYPAGCSAGGWSTEAACGSNGYIPDLWPEHVSEMPTDPRRGEQDGFSYRVNSDGTAYKLMVRGTVESETVTPEHPLAPCDMSSEWCAGECDTSSEAFQSSYAVWGGFASGANDSEVYSNTRAVICEL